MCVTLSLSLYFSLSLYMYVCVCVYTHKFVLTGKALKTRVSYSILRLQQHLTPYTVYIYKYFAYVRYVYVRGNSERCCAFAAINHGSLGSVQDEPFQFDGRRREFRVFGLGYRVLGLGLKAYRLGFQVESLGLAFRAWGGAGLRFRQGLGS